MGLTVRSGRRREITRRALERGALGVGQRARAAAPRGRARRARPRPRPPASPPRRRISSRSVRLELPIRSSRHETTTSSSSSRSSRRKSIATRARTKSHVVAHAPPRRAIDPLVPALLEIGRVDGVVDVQVRVDVAPADLDALLVRHGARSLTERMRAVTDVRALLFPRSLAVVGASPRNVAAVETVVRSGVPAWGVNPNRDEVAGLRCYPERRRAARRCRRPRFLIVNHERVEQAFEDAAAAGVRAFVVPGVGAEAGAARDADHRAARGTRAGARRGACSGRTAWASSSRAARRPGTAARRTSTAAGHVAVLCQSGLDRGRVPLARRARSASAASSPREPRP